MPKALVEFLATEAQKLQQAGLFRHEQPLGSPQGPLVSIGGAERLNLASADYLGLANHTLVKRGAKTAIDTWGVGVASPRPAIGTLPLHLELEQAVTALLGTEATIVYPSGYHANTGLLEALGGERDYVFCDDQIHPSLADGVRLSGARVLTYRNNDLDHLEDRLKRSRAARFRFIVSDSVSPLDGGLANLRAMCDLAEAYQAVVVMDDAQGLGVLGGGRGTAVHLNLVGRIDLISGSFANALGGGGGGFVSGRKEMIAWLRQRSRPYLTSTALSPGCAGAALAALDIVAKDPEPLRQLQERVAQWRAALAERGLTVLPGEHPIVPILIGDAVKTQRLADRLWRGGIFAMGFCHPVVPEGAARIRTQISAKHSAKSLVSAAEAFAEAAREVGIG